jgi:hypothetical protein
LRLGRNHPREALTVGGVPLIEKTSVGDLGVVIGRRLSFKEHVEKLVTEANRKVNFILRRFHHLDKTTLSTLTKLFITSVRASLEYCSVVVNKGILTLVNKGIQRNTECLAGILTLLVKQKIEKVQR